MFEHLPEPAFLLEPRDTETPEAVTECSGVTWNHEGLTQRFAWSLQWPVVECNRAACRRHGYRRDELIGRAMSVIGPLTSQPEVLVNLRRRLRLEHIVRLRALHQCEDGTYFPVEISASRVLLDGEERVLMLSRDISDWQRAEAESGKLAGFARAYPHPLIEFNSQGQIICYNAALEKLAQSLGEKTLGAILPTDITRLVKDCLATQRSGVSIDTEINGRHISWSLYPSMDERLVYAYAIDITDWCQPANIAASREHQPVIPGGAEPGLGLDHLRQSNGHHWVPVAESRELVTEPWSDTDLMTAVADAVVALNDAEEIRAVNPALEQLTGYTNAELLGQRFGNVLLSQKDAQENWAVALAQLRAGLEIPTLDLALTGKDHLPTIVEANVRTINRGGQSAGFVVSMRDIGERRRKEAELRQREARLVQAQRIGKLGSWELDVNTGAMSWSEEACRILGRAAGEHVPTRAALYDLVHTANREQLLKTHEQAINQGTAYGIEYRLLRPEKVDSWILEQAEAMVDGSGKVARVFGTVQDISQRKQQEELSRHVEKWEAIGRMAGGVAHDFNSILTDIRHCTELIQATPNLSGEIAPQLRKLAVAAERATNLTWQLLALSRRQALPPELLDLNQLINSVAGMLQHILQPDIELELRLADSLPFIPAHSSMLEQVLLHLIIHSRHAMPRGGRLTIETRLCEIDATYVQQQPEAKTGQHVCLRVHDTGSGAGNTRMGCIHEPFFTTKNVGQGTGLGLATVHGIVKQHQGWIDVSNELKQNAIFKVYLPVHPKKTDLLATEMLLKPIAGGSETLLLVESEPLLRALSRSILERYGYQILQAASGTEAIALWEKHHQSVSLLLTDLELSDGMSGQELAQRLQANNAAVKVLYTCGHSASVAQSRGTLKPGHNFLPKPYSATALGQAVRSCLDHQDDSQSGTSGAATQPSEDSSPRKTGRK